MVVTHLVRMGSHPLKTTTGAESAERVPHAKFARLPEGLDRDYEVGYAKLKDEQKKVLKSFVERKDMFVSRCGLELHVTAF